MRLWGNVLLILTLMRRKLTKAQKEALDGSHLVEVFLDPRDGELKVTGKRGADGLKASQEYTEQYLCSHTEICISATALPNEPKGSRHQSLSQRNQHFNYHEFFPRKQKALDTSRLQSQDSHLAYSEPSRGNQESSGPV